MKNHKLWNNGSIIKNYTIFRKRKVWRIQIYHQLLAVINLKGLKRPQKGANLENIRKWPLNDLKVPLRGQNDRLWSNGWLYWIQEVKIYKKWCSNLQYSNFSFLPLFSVLTPKIAYFISIVKAHIPLKGLKRALISKISKNDL